MPEQYQQVHDEEDTIYPRFRGAGCFSLNLVESISKLSLAKLTFNRNTLSIIGLALLFFLLKLFSVLFGLLFRTPQGFSCIADALVFKISSIFLITVEWISKGKAGVPVELGLRVCVVEDSYRFILHHQVMEKTTDDQIAVSIVKDSQSRFPALNTISMDKGFHSPNNQIQLKERLDLVILPKKGRLSEADKVRESDVEFVQLRRQHSAVESAINALEIHGLDKCPDQGIDGFKRYVALAIVARNIQRLGVVVREQALQKIARRRGSYQKAA